MTLTSTWDKTFPKSDKVDHRKVTFRNRYGITLAADFYLPKNRGDRKLAAIAVSGPFGAVKEQSSGLYAQTMAERGYAVVAFDPSYTGESGGEPRNLPSPEINTEDFSAANIVEVREGAPPVRQAYSVTGYCVSRVISPAASALKTVAAVISLASEAAGTGSSSARANSTVPVSASIR